MLESAQAAPDFTLPDQEGAPVTLSALRGGPVVVYFYPKADTPGCTTQACGVRDHHEGGVNRLSLNQARAHGVRALDLVCEGFVRVVLNWVAWSMKTPSASGSRR